MGPARGETNPPEPLLEVEDFAALIGLEYETGWATCPICGVGGTAATLFRVDAILRVLICTEFDCVIRPPLRRVASERQGV